MGTAAGGERPITINDLISVVGYEGEVYRVIGKSVSRHVDASKRTEKEIVFTITNVDNADDTLQCFVEDAVLVAREENVLSFLLKRKSRGGKRSPGDLMPRRQLIPQRAGNTVSDSTAIEEYYDERAIRCKIDSLLERYGDALTLNAVLGEDERRKEVIHFINKELETEVTRLAVGINV